MPSVKNPNTISKNRLAARAAKQKKARQKAAAAGQLVKRAGAASKADARRGARPGLLPTSGPRAPVSRKRQRKLERQLGYALRRKMEAEGEVEMKDAPFEKDDKKTKAKAGEEQEVKMDIS